MTKPELKLKQYKEIQMKMRLVKQHWFILILLSGFLYQCTNDSEPNQYTYTAHFAESDINIDGILNEDAWQNSEAIELRINSTGEIVEDSSIMTWVRVCYDEHNLYIAYECNDADIWSEFSNRDDHLWEKDAVEIFIDSDGNLNTYYEIQVSPKNVLFDAHLEIPTKTDEDEIIAFDIEGIQTAVNIDGSLNMHEDIDNKWTVEIAIPFADLIIEKASVESGTWRINFYRMNHDLKGERPRLAWSPTLAGFHTPEKFGVLKFAK